MTKKWKGHPRSGMITMPDDFDIFNACQERCDMAQGPCSCGATHSREGWVWIVRHSSSADFCARLQISAMVCDLDRGHLAHPRKKVIRNSRIAKKRRKP